MHKLYRNPFNDVERMEDQLGYAEDLAWSVVRATALRDAPASGRYQCSSTASCDASGR